MVLELLRAVLGSQDPGTLSPWLLFQCRFDSARLHAQARGSSKTQGVDGFKNIMTRCCSYISRGIQAYQQAAI